MSLNPKLFSAAYKQANKSDEVDCMSPEEAAPLLDWIRARLANPELLNLLAEFPLSGDEQLCAHYFFGLRAIKESTESSRLLAEKYLVVGSAANGDYIVIPFGNPLEVGFVNHETLDDVRGICEYVCVSHDLGEFYYNSWNQNGFPGDYYEAIRTRDA